MKKFDLISRPYDEFYDLMNQFFDRSVPLSKAFAGIKLDVQEQENDYIVEADLPGVEKSDITLDLIDHYLLIDVQQKMDNSVKEKNYVRKERTVTSSRRSVFLPQADSEGIEAKLENGVLTVTVPKASKEKQKRAIEIK